MDDRDRSPGERPLRRRRPSIEGLEGRQLLTDYSPTNTYLAVNVGGDHQTFVDDLQRIERKSHATPAQFLALRDDAQAISEAASATTMAPDLVQKKALAVSLLLDRAPLDGWMDERHWSKLRSQLAGDLNGLNVPPALIDRTIADMQAIARAAGVTAHQAATFKDAYTNLQADEAALPTNSSGYPAPGVLFVQHLRGFFGGGVAHPRGDRAKLAADEQAIASRANDTPSQAAVLRRDARLLEQVGGGVTSQADAQLSQAFLAAFDQGTPGDQDLARTKSNVLAALGGHRTSAELAAIDRLIADAGAFYQAAGASPANVRTIVDDVQALVADGAGSPSNPFTVQVRRGVPHV